MTFMQPAVQDAYMDKYGNLLLLDAYRERLRAAAGRPRPPRAAAARGLWRGL